MEDPLSFDSFPEANEAWDPSQLEVLDDQPPLGAGAMGIVYRGWYRGRSVAVKAITEVHRNNPKLISLFTREAQISCDCKHPNVVSTFGFDPEKMLLCIGLEYVSLKKFFEYTLRTLEETLPLNTIQVILRDISYGLQYLHREKIAHRDMNLGNFLISRDFVVKVSDFGLSRKLNTESSLTCGFGSENFRAPEVEIECYDTSCDIWSFGILAGNLCEIPKLTFSQDCPEISEQEDDEYKDFIQNIGVRAAKKYSTNRASACLNVSRRFGGKEDDNDEHVNLLLEVVRSCLFLVPPRRASFDSIAEKFRSQKLFPVEFPVAFLDSVARENSEHKLNPKFVDQIRQKNQKLTLSSFEWVKSKIEDASSQRMMRATIQDSCIDLVLSIQANEAEGEGGKGGEGGSKVEGGGGGGKTEGGGGTTSKKKIELATLWNSNKRKIYVVQGKAGAGKTTLLKWLAYQWSIGELWSGVFEAVIHIELRDLSNFKSLEKMLLDGVFNNNSSKKGIISEFLEKCESGARVLWILDGWDEVKVKGALNRIQEGREDRVKFLLAGSRPEAGMKLYSHGTIEVQGFSESGIQEYIRNYFRSADAHISKLNHLLSEQENLRDACKLPLMLNLTCFILPQLGSSGKKIRMTDIYRRAILHLVSRAKKYSLSMDIDVDEEEISEILQNFAFRNLREQEVHVMTEIRSSKKRDMLQSIGVLSFLSENLRWNHQSFMEFLSAEYCSVKFPDVQISEIQTRSPLFWTFFCGLNSENPALIQEFVNYKLPEFEELFMPQDLSRLQKETGIVLWDCAKNSEILSLQFLWNLAATYNDLDIIKQFLEIACARIEPDFQIPFMGVIEILQSELNIQLSYKFPQLKLEILQYFHDIGVPPKDLIWSAAQRGELNFLKLLVTDKNSADSALLSAVQIPNEEIITWLLGQGADPQPAFYLPARQGFIRNMELLSENGGDFRVPMHAAAKYGRFEIIKFLVSKRGAHPDLGIDGASKGGQSKILQYLLDQGGNPELGLHSAIKYGYFRIVHLLSERIETIDPRWLIESTHTRILKELAEKCTDLNSALRGMEACHQKENINFLVEKSADPNIPMPRAAKEGDHAWILFLLDKGADANSAMLFAAGGGHVDLVKLLLEKGAEPDSALRGVEFRGEEDREDIKKRHSEIFNLLSERGANTELLLKAAIFWELEQEIRVLGEHVDPNGGIAEAALMGNLKVVDFFLERGGTPELGVLEAASKGYPKVAPKDGAHTQILLNFLDLGVSPDLAMVAACQAGVVEHVLLLLDLQGDPNLGMAAAMLGNQKEVVSVLLAAGASPDEGMVEGVTEDMLTHMMEVVANLY